MLQGPRPGKLDCYTQVVTPENIAFEYALAGPFQRVPAYLLDLTIRGLILIGFWFVGGFLATLLGLSGLAGPLLGFSLLILYFVLSWFYGILFEALKNGQTPGKAMFGLRAISIDGRPINGIQAAIRNLLRVADMNIMLSIQMFSPDLPPVYLIPLFSVGFVVMLATKRMQRIGDLAAGTMVISEKHQTQALQHRIDDLRAYGLEQIIPADFVIPNSMARTIGLYMENRSRLSAPYREELASCLASPLIRSFGMLPDTSSDLLLCALYARTFISEKEREKGVQLLRQASLRASPLGLNQGQQNDRSSSQTPTSHP